MREVMTDNARELSMGEMRQICEQEGIKTHMSVRYSPESNGVAEHTIGVLTNAVRAMLHDSGLPRILWAEAYNAARYLHNGTPMRELGGRAPYEVPYDVKPDVLRLGAFGAPSAIVSLMTERLCVSLWVTSTKGAVIGVWTQNDKLSSSPEKLFSLSSLRLAIAHSQ